ncbi:MAG: polysaccharide deacetylase family protein [Oscillospiraceae bacterium]|jgi:polysaccharide deacetylase family sporulation protein PdaB|nr:polysaccharide deacetylase family protein [Oscillospiraceae bacterium]
MKRHLNVIHWAKNKTARLRSLRGRQLLLTIRRRKLAVFGVLLCAAAIFYVVSAPAFVGASATQRELPIYNVKRDNKMVSLTFDAAWGNEDTQQLIDILAKYKVHATFFVVGQWAEKYPESVKALSDAGHEIMNHSYDHPHLNKMNADEIVSNLTSANNAISKVTGKSPTLFRAPYGEYDDHVVKAIRAMGMNVIQWDVDSLDWKEISAAEITKRVTGKVKSGSIVLFHNAALHTPEALPGIIEYLIQNGYTIVPVSEIILQGEIGADYYIDNNGTQVKK